MNAKLCAHCQPLNLTTLFPSLLITCSPSVWFIRTHQLQLQCSRWSVDNQISSPSSSPEPRSAFEVVSLSRNSKVEGRPLCPEYIIISSSPSDVAAVVAAFLKWRWGRREITKGKIFNYARKLKKGERNQNVRSRRRPPHNAPREILLWIHASWVSLDVYIEVMWKLLV